MEYCYYVYAYLRRESRIPYYIGKGKGNRARQKTNRSVSVPKDSSMIKLFQTGLTSDDAFKLEIAYIKLFGRKNLGEGVLLNKTNGGEGCPGRKYVMSDYQKRRISETTRGRPKGPMSDEHKQKLSAALINRPKSENAKKAMSLAKLGKKRN